MQLLCFVSLSIIGGSAIFGNQFGKAVWKDDPQAYRRFAAFVQRVRGLWLPGSWKGKAAGNGETVTPSVSCLGCSDCRSQALDHIYCHSFVLKQFAEFAFLRNQLLKVGAAVSLQHLCHHEKQSGAVACGMRWACAHLAEPLGLHGGDTQNFSWHLRWCPVGADVDAISQRRRLRGCVDAIPGDVRGRKWDICDAACSFGSATGGPVGLCQCSIGPKGSEPFYLSEGRRWRWRGGKLQEVKHHFLQLVRRLAGNCSCSSIETSSVLHLGEVGILHRFAGTSDVLSWYHHNDWWLQGVPETPWSSGHQFHLLLWHYAMFGLHFGQADRCWGCHLGRSGAGGLHQWWSGLQSLHTHCWWWCGIERSLATKTKVG